MGALTPPRRNLAGYAKRRKPFAGADASNGQHNGLCRNISFYPKAIPHNSKCRYGERGAAAAKPKAQIILDAAKVSAASGGNSEPKQGQRSQSARGFCPRSTMRVPQPDIIEHFGNADAVPQLPERCLSRKAGIVRYCPYSFFISLYSKNSNPLFLYTCTARAFSSSTSSRSRASGYFFVM